MKSVLTLFMLTVFVMFAMVDNAEAALDLNSDLFLDQLEAEAVSIAPSVFVLERAPGVEMETAPVVMKWRHEDVLSLTGLDAQNPTSIESSSAEGRNVGVGIWPSGASR